MRLSDFDYDLPPGLIAQAPLEKRDASRMMVIDRKTGAIDHKHFCDIDAYLTKGDAVVINDSKVIPARLTGRKATGSLIEMLLLSRIDDKTDACAAIWDVLLKPAKRVRAGSVILFGQAGEARIVERLTEKKWRLAFSTASPFEEFLHLHGTAPLPPYIKRKVQADGIENDLERYQTVYARIPGSVAAPTAGFHFSAQVLDRMVQKGVSVVAVTLHVGYGTFLPVETADVAHHVMEEEWYELSPEAARQINNAKRVIAVGTTATRVLESLADDSGIVRPATGTTALFIYPGYRFKRVNGLLTNFHLPKSSLYLLASAFAGLPLLRKAYAIAIENRYRFYSYGDCTFMI